MPATDTANLAACPTCGLIQRLPRVPQGKRAACRRCRASLRHHSPRASASTAAALALAGLILYPFAILMPVMRVQELGHTNVSSIWDGMLSLFKAGQSVVGLVVLFASIIAPLGKLAALLTLCAGDALMHPRAQAGVYRLVEWLGRWGMLDVLLVAVLVATVKLGDWVRVQPGPGVLAFASVVILSLLASAAFDPRAIWSESDA